MKAQPEEEREMTNRAWGATAGVMMAILIGSACARGDRSKEVARAKPASAEMVKRGEYLVKIMVCNDCHTPLKLGPNGPEPDMDRMLSGHPEQIGPMPVARHDGGWGWSGAETNTAFSGPWGVSYTANLTPDQNTGLGIWTEDMFIKAIRTGKHMGTSRDILPPMPWPMFRSATDEDLKSIW